MTIIAFRKVTDPRGARDWRGGRTEKNCPSERGLWPWREGDGYSRDIRETEMMGRGGW